ncbi:hypothetical protein HS088_TW21G01528 [Tripterygium wilfordii]|uniref:Ethylene insensitive 3-like DNA-binding domain-containing protein n=1 Tax=Tripterygium wilfordii TaxID=458696 RepID=A0A7J7C5F0_TRIWF|nr:hypothetical protein HS088_TW21G01528 [Tripterygium wilfordii]
MGIFEDMGFCSNLDFVSVPSREVELAAECEAVIAVEQDDSDEDMDVDELERRMWRDRMLLKRLKEQNKNKEGIDSAKQRQSQEQARRKKMSRAQDGILKYMLKMMEVCKAQGFVYGIIPEKGKPVGGASDNLRAWWKEKVSCLPLSAVGSGSYATDDTSDYDVEGVDKEQKAEVEECKLHDVSLLSMGAAGQKDRVIMSPFVPQIKEEFVGNSSDFNYKRKHQTDEQQILMDQNIYTCEYPQCPYNDYRFGFLDRTSRNNHQLRCTFRDISSQQVGMSNFQVTDETAAVFNLPFAQTKPTMPPVNQTTSNMSGLGLPEDGQKMISELMSFYDSSLQREKSMDPVGVNVVGCADQQPRQLQYHQQEPQQQIQQQELQHQQPKFELHPADSSYGQGVLLGGNISQGTNLPLDDSFFPSVEIQLEQCKAFDSPFGTNYIDGMSDFRFGSHFSFGSTDCIVDSHPKQGLAMW